MEFNDFVNAVLHGGAITLSIFILLVVLSVVTWGNYNREIFSVKEGRSKRW